MSGAAVMRAAHTAHAQLSESLRCQAAALHARRLPELAPLRLLSSASRSEASTQSTDLRFLHLADAVSCLDTVLGWQARDEATRLALALPGPDEGDASGGGAEAPQPSQLLCPDLAARCEVLDESSAAQMQLMCDIACRLGSGEGRAGAEGADAGDRAPSRLAARVLLHHEELLAAANGRLVGCACALQRLRGCGDRGAGAAAFRALVAMARDQMASADAPACGRRARRRQLGHIYDVLQDCGGVEASALAGAYISNAGGD